MGERVPWFEGLRVDGSILSTSDLDDSPAMLLFLSEGCAPCRQLASDVRRTGLESALGLELIVVVRDRKDLDELGLDGVNAIVQPEGSIQRAFQTSATPHAFVIRNGFITAAGHPNTAEALLQLGNDAEGGQVLGQSLVTHLSA